MKTRNIFGVICLALVMAIPAKAQEIKKNEAMSFSRIVRNPAMAGKGFAGLAKPESMAWSSFGNSAVIPFSEETFDVGVIYQNWAPGGTKSANLALGTAGRFTKNFGASLGFVMQSGEKFPIYNESGALKGESTPSDLQVNLGLGYKFGEVVAVGLNAKYMRSSLMEGAAYSAFATDIFAQCRFAGASVALGISNLGSSVKDSEGNPFKIPASVTLGADYTLKVADLHAFNFDLDCDYFFSGNFAAAFGFEYGVNDMVFARAGYHFGTEHAVLPSFASVGIGLKFFGAKLDLAYLTANEFLGNTIVVGLGYSF